MSCWPGWRGRALWNNLFSSQLIKKLREMLNLEQGVASGRCWGSCHSETQDVETAGGGQGV